MRQPVPYLLHRRRRVIAHDAKVAFAGHRAVYRVAAIKRQAVGGGLHVLPAEGHLGLAEAQAKILPLVEEDVRIGVPQLGESLPPLASRLIVHRRCEIGLKIERAAAGNYDLKHTQKEKAWG